MSLIRPTHAQALETYWRQLELMPHRKITLGVTTLQCASAGSEPTRACEAGEPTAAGQGE